MAKTKVKKPWWQEWDVLPASLLLVITAVLGYGWRFVETDMLSQFGVFGLLGGAVAVMVFGRFSKKQQINILRLLVHGTAMFLLWRIIWGWWNWEYLDGKWFNSTTFFTGKAAISFLFLSLAVTPLVMLFGWSPLNQIKKSTGNYGFIFVAIHLVMFAFDFGVLNGKFNIRFVIDEAISKRYALVGFIAFLLLIPLFATSNKWSQKRLGKDWKKLHRWVYVINVLAVAHYGWVHFSKLALRQPILFAIGVGVLLILRIDSVKKRVRAFKQARRRAKRATA